MFTKSILKLSIIESSLYFKYRSRINSRALTAASTECIAVTNYNPFSQKSIVEQIFNWRIIIVKHPYQASVSTTTLLALKRNLPECGTRAYSAMEMAIIYKYHIKPTTRLFLSFLADNQPLVLTTYPNYVRYSKISKR